jgi:hypothetical protein
VIHYDAYLELRRFAGAEGALELEAHRRRRVVVGRERAEFGGAAGIEVGSRILRVGVSVPLHPHVDVTCPSAASRTIREDFQMAVGFLFLVLHKESETFSKFSFWITRNTRALLPILVAGT